MEIELKFTLSPSHINDVQQAILQSPFQTKSKPTLILGNAYYDTLDNDLRQWDFGLRTRTSTDVNNKVKAEQTIKLSGKDVAGLQQRPEYNVDIPLSESDAPFANLKLFDESIWPKNFPVQEINQKLHKVFETTFERKTWDLQLANGALVECVLDQGQVEAEFEGELKSEPICELELELKEGKVNDLFEVAFHFINQFPAKLGLLSKAARGYHLAQNKPLKIKNLESIEYSGKNLLEPAFINMLNTGIEFIQHNEIVFSRDKKPKSLRRVMDGASLIIQVLELFKRYFPHSSCELYIEKFKQWRGQTSWIEPFYQLEKLCSRKSPYRKDIENSESLLAMLAQRKTPKDKVERALQAFSSTEFNQLFLSFVQWVSTKGWRNEMSLSDLSYLNIAIEPISEQFLDHAWRDVKNEIKHLDLTSDVKKLEAAYWTLAAGLLTGVAVSGFYMSEQRLAFRGHLLNLLLGLEEGILLSKLQKLINEEVQHAIEPDSASSKNIDNGKNLKWLKSKRNSLNMALNASIDAVLKLKPYW